MANELQAMLHGVIQAISTQRADMLFVPTDANVYGEQVLAPIALVEGTIARVEILRFRVVHGLVFGDSLPIFEVGV